MIRQPEIVETSKKLTEGEILRISIENKEEYDEFTVYPAVKAMCENNEYCDNTGNLINYISESLTENHLATLLCSGECFNNLEKDPILKKTHHVYLVIEMTITRQKCHLGGQEIIYRI